MDLTNQRKQFDVVGLSEGGVGWGLKTGLITSFLPSQQEKPQGYYTHCSPSLQGAKYIVVTQDMSPGLCSERCDEYLFGLGLGQANQFKHAFYCTT